MAHVVVDERRVAAQDRRPNTVYRSSRRGDEKSRVADERAPRTRP
jgi:hypothetical protein